MVIIVPCHLWILNQPLPRAIIESIGHKKLGETSVPPSGDI